MSVVFATLWHRQRRRIAALESRLKEISALESRLEEMAAQVAKTQAFKTGEGPA